MYSYFNNQVYNNMNGRLNKEKDINLNNFTAFQNLR